MFGNAGWHEEIGSTSNAPICVSKHIDNILIILSVIRNISAQYSKHLYFNTIISTFLVNNLSISTPFLQQLAFVVQNNIDMIFHKSALLTIPLIYKNTQF